MAEFLRELFTLIKMVFSSRPSDFEAVDMISMKHFPFKGYLMMWCGKLICRHEDFEKYSNLVERYPSWRFHEMIHLKQSQLSIFKDSWLVYYLSYFLEWIKGHPIFNTHKGAYYTISFEVEAYANEDNLDYVALDNLKNSKYDLKNRVRLYKENRKYWKTYIKGL